MEVTDIQWLPFFKNTFLNTFSLLLGFHATQNQLSRN